MTTVKQRLEWWRKRSFYLGDEVTATQINRITYDKYGNPIKSSTIVVDITIYTKSRNNAVERVEKWIVPDATPDDYLEKPAYMRRYSISSTMRYVIMRRRRRWW